MAITIKDIHDIRDYLTNVFHVNRIKEQEEDQKYIDDGFSIGYLPEGIAQIKTGKAYRMCSAPAEHIISSNPQVYREPVGKGIEQAKRLAQELNRWVRIMLRQNPQPFKEHIRKILGTGEGWIYLPHNPYFKPDDPNDMPVQFRIPHSTVVFADPEAGERNGVPQRVVVYMGRVAGMVKKTYPWWTWRERGNRDWTDVVDFMMYYDNEVRYFEADKEAVLLDEKGKLGSGIQPNIYGFVPFVHCYSGFGEGSPDGDPEKLAVSRIRKIRDLIAEYTAIRSMLNYQIFSFGVPPLDLIYDPAVGAPSGDIGESYDRSPGAFNVMGLPAGATLKRGVEMLPDQQLFQHLYNIERQISEEDPLGLVGQQIGTSGRQQIEAEAGALRRYDSVVDNSANAFMTAFGLALKMMEKLDSTLRPALLNKGDIAGSYEVKLELKAEDPIANQIKSVDGDRKQTQGIIDHETNLIRYQGYTQEQAQKIIARKMVDDVVMNDPVIRRLMAIQVAREMGMEEQYTALEAQLAQMEKGIENRGLESTPRIGSQGGEPRMGNIKTPRGMEEIDMSLAQKPRRLRPIQ